MVIPWNALGVVGGAIVFVYDRTKDRRAKAKAALEAVGAAVPPAPQFENGPADVALFTRYRGPGLETRQLAEHYEMLARNDKANGHPALARKHKRRAAQLRERARRVEARA